MDLTRKYEHRLADGTCCKDTYSQTRQGKHRWEKKGMCGLVVVFSSTTQQVLSAQCFFSTFLNSSK